MTLQTRPRGLTFEEWLAADLAASSPRPAARVYPEALAGARPSTVAVFESIVRLAEAPRLTDATTGRLGDRLLDFSIGNLAKCSTYSPTTERRAIAFLERRGLVERIDSGQGCRTKLRVLWSFNGPLPRPRHRAPTSTEVLLSRWSDCLESSGTRQIEVCLRGEMNPATGRAFSSSTVNRAIHYAVERGFFYAYEGRRRGGRGHGTRFTLAAPTVAYWWSHEGRGVTRLARKACDALNANEAPFRSAVESPLARPLRPSYQREEVLPNTAKDKTIDKDFSTLRACSEGLRPLHDAEQLTRWLSQADLDRLPTAREKRKLSHAIRLLASASVEGVADALLSALWWRTHAPLRLWRDAIDAVQTEPPGSDAGELTRWAHALLKRLSGPSVKPQTPEEPGEFDAIFGPGIRREDMEAESKARQAAVVALEAAAKERRAAPPSDAAVAACMVIDLTEPGDRYTPRPPCPLIPREAFL